VVVDARRQGAVLPGPEQFHLSARFIQRPAQRAEMRFLHVFDDGDTHHANLANE
jgi:hypothetical protein